MTIPNDHHISAEQLHHTTIRTDVAITFTAWNNQSIAAKLLYIEMKQLDLPNKIQVLITVELDLENFQTMLQHTMFHTVPTCFIANTALISASPITATLLLQPGIATTLLQTNKDAETVLAALLSEQLNLHNTYPLHNESYWYLLEATQAIDLPDTLQTTGKLQHHVKTNWLTTLYESTNKQQSANNSISLLAQVTEYIEAEHLNYEWFDDNIIRIAFTQAQQQWLLLLFVNQTNHIIETYSVFPHQIPVADQPTCALQLLHLQQQLESGSFELDNDDGELRFRLALNCPNNIVEQTAFQTLLGSQMQVMKFLFSYLELKE